MDRAYANSVRLLLSVASDVFANRVFAMKGGTAINLFVRDMPRLSVDIDVVYTPWKVPRDESLVAISAELAAISGRLRRRGLNSRAIVGADQAESKLLIDDGDSQIKVEVNRVFRGTVLPVERRSLVASTAAMFSVELEVPVLAVDELYGSKLVAAMDRQHPRDLFDVWQMYEAQGLTEGAVETFTTYLAGHNRPIHEVLFADAKNIESEFAASFVGMTVKPVELHTLNAVRARFFKELPQRLTERQRRFLVGLAKAEPDFSLLACPHAAELPALRWKLANLKTFQKRRSADFQRHAQILESRLVG